MIRETYRGVTIQTAKGQRGRTKLTVNGVNLGDREGTEEHLVHIAKGTIDLVQDDQKPTVHGAHWYPRGTIDPKALVREIIADRFWAPQGQRLIVRQYVTQRVADIIEGMQRTPASYDTATGRFTEKGAEVVTQILGNDAKTGYAWREIEQMIEDAERETAK